MRQTYGIARDSGAEAVDSGVGNNETNALLGDRDSAVAHKGSGERDGHATLGSCISNLSNTIIGTGMLTFPLAMASSGLIPGILTCLFSGSTAGFGLYLLSRCATYTPHRRASFNAVSQLTFPKAAVFFDAAIAIKCFGVSISYLIIIKGLMPNVVASFYHDLSSGTVEPPPWTLDGGNWVWVFALVLVPLCFLRRIDSLRHTSYVALFSAVYLIVIVIRSYFWPLKGMTPPGEIRLVKFRSDFISTFPVQVFAFTCAQNLFPLYNEVASNTQSRMNMMIGGSIGSALITYEIVAVFGYLTFGSKVGANIIAMYPSTSIFVAVGQLAIVILVLFSYPLQVHPCRNSVDKVLHSGRNSTYKPVATDDEDDGHVDEHGGGDLPTWKFALITIVIVVSGFSTAFFVSDLRLVLSFVGSTGSTTITFILPGLLYWKLTRNDPSANKTLNWAALGLMVYGMCVFVFCLGSNVWEVVRAEGKGPAGE